MSGSANAGRGAETPLLAGSARFDVFVSYARDDRAFVVALVKELEARDKNVFVDVDDIPPAADWRRKVWLGLEASKVVIAVLTPDSVRSQVCADELEHAAALKKRIVPLVRRTVAPELLPTYLTAPNWIWLRDEDDAAAGHAAILEALERDEPWLDAHARLTTRALEWAGSGRDSSFLLRGSELDGAGRWLALQGEHREAATALQAQYILAGRHAASRRRQVTSGGVLLALLIAIALSVLALVQRHDAVHLSQTARSRELAASAIAQTATDPELAVLLAAEGMRVSRTRQATAALRTALAASHLVAQQRMPALPVGPPALTRDGRHLLQGGVDGVGRVFDTRDGSVVATLRAPTLPGPQSPYFEGGPDFGAAFARDGRYAATLSFDGVARIWDWRRQRVVATMRGAGKVRIAFSPDGRLLAVGSSLWDWRRERHRRIADAGSYPDYTLVAFDPSGRYRVVAGIDVDTRVLDVRSGRRVSTLRGPAPEFVTSVGFSADGRLLVRGTSNGVAEVWDWRRRRRRAAVRRAGEFAEASFGVGDGTVVVGTSDGTIGVSDWAHGSLLAELRGHRGSIVGVAPVLGGVLSTAGDGTLRRWRVRVPTTLPVAAHGVASGVAFSTDGRVVASASVDGGPHPQRRLDVSDARTGTRLARLSQTQTGFDQRARTSFGADGRLVLETGAAGEIRIWDWRSRRLLGLLGHDGSPVGDAAFGDRDRIVATTTARRGTFVWAWRRHRVLARLPALAAPADRPGRIDVSPAGDLVAVTEGGAVRVWDWRRRRVVGRVSVPAGATDVNFDRTGRLLAVAAADGVARIVDWRGGDIVAQLRTAGSLETASFDAGGELVITGGTEALTVWDWRTEERIVDLERARDGGRFEDARFGPDATRVVAVGVDGRAHLYECEACGGDLIEQAARRVTRVLGRQERRRYLHSDG